LPSPDPLIAASVGQGDEAAKQKRIV